MECYHSCVAYIVGVIINTTAYHLHPSSTSIKELCGYAAKTPFKKETFHNEMFFFGNLLLSYINLKKIIVYFFCLANIFKDRLSYF